jgi:ribosomal protein L7/L12
MNRCPLCRQEIAADDERCPSCGALLAKPLEAELKALLDQGRKIEAIKLYREHTGVGLREAKEAVEALAAGTDLPVPGQIDPNLEQDLLVLLERNQKIAAIKLYRDATGATLKEAKDAIEALTAAYGLTPGRSGCFGMALLMLALGWLLFYR